LWTCVAQPEINVTAASAAVETIFLIIFGFPLRWFRPTPEHGAVVLFLIRF